MEFTIEELRESEIYQDWILKGIGQHTVCTHIIEEGHEYIIITREPVTSNDAFVYNLYRFYSIGDSIVVDAVRRGVQVDIIFGELLNMNKTI